jgi:hypothetical protein
MRHQCISTTVTFFLLLINKNNLTQTCLAHSRWLACDFNLTDVLLDVASTSDEHADEAGCHRNYAVRMSGSHQSYGKWQGTRHFYLFSDSNPGAHCSRVSCIKGTPVGVKRLGREAYHSPAPSTDVNSEWSNNFTTQTGVGKVGFQLWVRETQSLFLYYYYYLFIYSCII